MTSPTAKERAETEKAQAEAEYNRQQAAREALLVEAQEMTVARQRYDHDFGQASDIANRVYHFNDQFDAESCVMCYTHLVRWFRMDPDKPTTVFLTSPGGDAWQGMALVDQVLSLREQGLEVNITVRGVAASMATIFLQAGTVRRMGPRSTLLIHKPSIQVGGSLDQIEDVTKWIGLINDQALDLFAERCAQAGENGTAAKPFTRRQLAAGMNRKDWSLTPAEALAGGLIDEIA